MQINLDSTKAAADTKASMINLVKPLEGDHHFGCAS